MAEITYHVASTLDGFIAHLDGSFDGFDWDEELVKDFFSDLKEYGTVLMGRKTYEVGLREGKASPYPDMRQVVFSKTLSEPPHESIEIISNDMIGFVKQLKAESKSPIWLCGGSEIASALMGEHLIDHVVVKLNPVIFGSGIPMFGEDVSLCRLKLVDTKTYGSGITLMSYKVA